MCSYARRQRGGIALIFLLPIQIICGSLSGMGYRTRRLIRNIHIAQIIQQRFQLFSCFFAC
ncbi:hypothetical protein IMY97_11325 [Pectobacterium versatile]|uniref:hypothetical protein n=1 Tax=Pectobacterium versatile TaxID=2488639 RepID=UPI0016613055|nr:MULTISPECIES: hypothetical protein [Pectobacterium]QUI36329.1 hypothetical protein IMY97_11325 [Pectobacterium versatile]